MTILFHFPLCIGYYVESIIKILKICEILVVRFYENIFGKLWEFFLWDGN